MKIINGVCYRTNNYHFCFNRPCKQAVKYHLSIYYDKLVQIMAWQEWFTTDARQSNIPWSGAHYICNILLLKILTSISSHKKYENNSQHHSQINKRVLFQNVTHNSSQFWFIWQTINLRSTGTRKYTYICVCLYTGSSVTTQQQLQQLQEVVCCIQTTDNLNLEGNVVIQDKDRLS